MTKEQAKKILDDYIVNNDEKLSIIRYVGDGKSNHYFECKTINDNSDLPGVTDTPTLAVFEDGIVLPLPT